MENSKKIIFYILTILLFQSCKGQYKKYNKDFIFKNDKGEIIFKVPSLLGNKQGDNFYSKNDTIFFKSVITLDKSQVQNKKTIDFETFEIIPNNEEEKKIINQYYLSNPFHNYFKDKNYIYIYSEENNTPIFFQGGKINEYKLLGGAYLKINNKIYWRGNQILGADISSFKVINVQRNNSEWETFIGLDKKHLYSGDKIMDYEQFLKNYLWDNESEYQKKYFPNKK